MGAGGRRRRAGCPASGQNRSFTAFCRNFTDSCRDSCGKFQILAGGKWIFQKKTYHKQVLAHVVGLLAAAVGAAALIGAVRLCRKPKEAALLDRGSQAKFGLNLS